MEIMTWGSQGDFEAWLLDFPRRYRLPAEQLYEMYQDGAFPDNEEVWEWAQFWRRYGQAAQQSQYEMLLRSPDSGFSEEARRQWHGTNEELAA